MTYEELHPLLLWRVGDLRGWTPTDLSASLGDVPYEEVPEKLFPLLVGFRHRRQDGRLALCRRFLKERQEGKKRPSAPIRPRKADRMTLVLSRGRALELGLLVCACGHPENNHFGRGEPNFGGRSCARCEVCKGYREQGISGVAVGT